MQEGKKEEGEKKKAHKPTLDELDRRELKSGFVDVADFNREIQKLFFPETKDDATKGNQELILNVNEEQRKLQEEQLEEQRKTNETLRGTKWRVVNVARH